MRFPRAIVFDVYGTLLHIEPAPRSDANWLKTFGVHRADFQNRVRREIARRHEIARESGVAHPEIQWPEVVAAILPKACPASVARFERVTTAAEGARELLDWLRSREIPIGLVSNAQAYTLDELVECGFPPDWFSVRFFSFQHGFSKPEPEVFHWIARQSAPLAPADILIVGDRWDNDILPARSLGFATWHVAAPGLNDLTRWLKSLVS